jgi:TetR/AcrR family transcriptional regulator, transcriptional repressor for nem operon
MSRKPNIEARQAILRAAHDLILRQGFKGVSMDDIAQAAGLKKANLFHYYPTKEALGLAVFDYAIQETREGSCCGLGDSSRDPIDAVECLFDNAASRMERRGCSGGCFVGNMAQELSDYNETLRLRVAEHLEHWAQKLSGYLGEYQARRYFVDAFDPAGAAQAILSLFEGAILFCKADRQTSPLRNARQMVRRYLESFRVPPASAA